MYRLRGRAYVHSIGTLVRIAHYSLGTLAHYSLGTLAHYSPGTLAHYSPGILAHVHSIASTHTCTL